MNIWIDIQAVQNSRGQNELYFPTVHWTLDDHDTIPIQRMDELKDILQAVLSENLDLKKILTPLKKFSEAEGETPRRESDAQNLCNAI